MIFIDHEQENETNNIRERKTGGINFPFVTIPLMISTLNANQMDAFPDDHEFYTILSLHSLLI